MSKVLLYQRNNKKLLFIIILLIFFGFLLVNFIKSPIDKKFLEKTEENISRKEYHRDSLLLLNTMYQFCDSAVYPFDFYTDYNKKNKEKAIFYLNKIFYSADKLKFLSLGLGKKINENKQSSSYTKYVFATEILIGYRNSIDSLWKIYPFIESGFEDYTDSLKIIEEFCIKYFEKLKFDQRYVEYPDGQQMDVYFVNLCDPLFWSDTTFIWRKGSKSFENYYWFEIKPFNAFKPAQKQDWKNNVKKGLEKEEDIYVRGNKNYIYPDSILQLWGQVPE